MRVLPSNRDYGWTPAIWLIYLSYFLVRPLTAHIGVGEWVATIAATAVFVVLYFYGYWVCGWRLVLNIAAMTLLGVVFSPFNYGACVFFIYASSFAPFVSTPLVGVELLAGILAIVGIEAWAFHLPSGFWLPASVISALLVAVNTHYAQRHRANAKLRMANEEIEHLAKVAERERIARDLHDVLGHTLSVIILKSELAGKLIDRDPERAKAEIRDVEQTSRDALAEVRSTIRGIRLQSLEAELKQAKDTLETAGIQVTSECAKVPLTPVQESVITMVVREAVTNVVRHAHARNFALRMSQTNGHCILDIADDGSGGTQIEGSGLRGMRERVEALGGDLERDTRSGTRLRVRIPVSAPKESTPS